MGETLEMRPVEYLFLQVRLPGRRPENAGVVLLDLETDRLFLKLRREWDSFGEESDVLSELEASIRTWAGEKGGATTLRYLSEFSNTLAVTDLEKALVSDPEARLRRLYRENVNEVGAVPVVQLRAAAGALSEEQLPGTVTGSVDPPDGVRAAPGMFAARVVGASMEPLIPNGSLCLFRPAPAGSRNGKRLLIERFGTIDATAQYTVKVYRSEKRFDADGNWEHEAIRMIPLNPTFEEWTLTPEEFRVVGEFVAVLPPEE